MRSHGTASRFPWDYGEVGIHTYQTHYWLRENLLNKIYSAAVVSHKTGLPITKPLTMAYPDDRPWTVCMKRIFSATICL